LDAYPAPIAGDGVAAHLLHRPYLPATPAY
jgi:hypothetical protein